MSAKRLCKSVHTNKLVGDLISLSVVSRTAHASILFSYFDVPIGVLVLTTAVDTLAIIAPVVLFAPGQTIVLEPRLALKKDTTLTIVLTCISSAFLSIFSYVAHKTFQPAFVVGHFDSVKSVTPQPLPLLMAGLLPTGYCLQHLIAKHGFMQGAIMSLVSNLIVSGSSTAMALRGADIVGAIGVTQAWNVSLVITCCILGFIMQAR